jgi:hypothetical protein
VDAYTVDEVLRIVQASKPCTVGDAALVPPMVLQSEAQPAVAWQPSDIEAALEVKLPEEIKLLWSRASELRLHEDVNYGQWGCILWSPVEIVARHRQALGWRGRDDFRPGDVILGEFRGDADLVVLRCDPSQTDYGTIVVALAMDPRDDWPCVSSSITEFVLRFLSRPDKKFWEASA